MISRSITGVRARAAARRKGSANRAAETIPAARPIITIYIHTYRYVGIDVSVDNTQV